MKAQQYMAEMILMMRRIQQPIISAVHGHAYGGDVEEAATAFFEKRKPNFEH